MKKRSGLTLAELLIAVAALAAAATILAYAVTVGRSEQARHLCQNNLNQLAKGFATYMPDCGDNRFFPWPVGRAGCGTRAAPSFGGAESLALLYWCRIIPDPFVFLCPAARDGNGKGQELGSEGTPGGRPLSAHAVSYAAFHDRSVGIYMSSKQNRPSYLRSQMAVRDDFPPNEPMACDDTEEPVNHGTRAAGGMNVLFCDNHVEYWTHEKVDLETGVGRADLCALRN